MRATATGRLVSRDLQVSKGTAKNAFKQAGGKSLVTPEHLLLI